MQTNQPSNEELIWRLNQFEKNLAAYPGNRDLLATAIDVYLAVGKVEEARRHADVAIACFPDDRYFQHRDGNVLLALGQAKDAEIIFKRLFQESGDANVGFNLAYAYYLQSRYREAEQLLSPMTEQPDRPHGSLTLLLRTLHRLGQIKQAIELVERNTVTSTNDFDFLSVASLLYFDDAQLERARQTSQAALAGPVRLLEALVVSGHIALGDGDIAGASAQFAEAIGISPMDGRSWAGLGLTSMVKRDLTTATNQLEKAVSYMPTHIGTRHALGWCKILSNDLVAANEIFQQALSLDQNFGESHSGLAVVCALRGDRSMAEDSIRRALGLDPKNLSARYAQMVLTGDMKDPEKFRDLAFKALSEREGSFGKNLIDGLTQFMRR